MCRLLAVGSCIPTARPSTASGRQRRGPGFLQGKDSPNLALLAFFPHTAEYWDAPNSKMVRMLAMAASVVAGKPVGMGDHATLTGLTPDFWNPMNTASRQALLAAGVLAWRCARRLWRNRDLACHPGHRAAARIAGAQQDTAADGERRASHRMAPGHPAPAGRRPAGGALCQRAGPSALVAGAAQWRRAGGREQCPPPNPKAPRESGSS
jgi:hypothetical protein